MESPTKYETFNDYMARYEAVANPLIRAYQHLVQPGLGYAHYTNERIISLWHDWSLARVEFWRVTGSGILPRPSCPEAPPDDEEHQPCREMWGQMMREIVEQGGANANVESVKGTVAKILSSNACKSHPATCPCKVPKNPWTWKQSVEALEPLGITHHQGCRCSPPLGCKQRLTEEKKVNSPTAVLVDGGCSQVKVISAASRYVHNVDTCACGTCHKARVTAGTDDEYYMRCKKASLDSLNDVSKHSPHNPDTCACGTCHRARVASGTQGAYDEWNRKLLDASLEKYVNSKGYSATMRRVYCPSDPANASSLGSLVYAQEEASLFREGNSLLHKLSKTIGSERFRERLALIREFVTKLEAFLERGKGGLLDSTLRKAMQCDDNITTREALASSWTNMQGLLADVFCKLPPEVTASPLNSLLAAEEANGMR